MSELRGRLGRGGIAQAAIEVAGWLAEEGAAEVAIGDLGGVRTLKSRVTNLPAEMVAAVERSGAVTLDWVEGGVRVRLDQDSFAIQSEARSPGNRLAARLEGCD